MVRLVESERERDKASNGGEKGGHEEERKGPEDQREGKRKLEDETMGWKWRENGNVS